jgi:hypothetical protein
MAGPLTGRTAITTLVTGDLVYVVRPSLGASGSKKMTVDDFMQSGGDLIDKWIYVLGGMMLEPQVANAVIAIGVPTEDITIPSAGNRSAGKALFAATGSTTFSIKKNGVEFGTMNVGAAATVPSFSFPGDTSFIGGTDYITVHNPASPDPTLAVFGFSIFGRRT